MFRADASRHVKRRLSARTGGGRSEGRVTWWKRIFCFVAATAGLLSAGMGAEASPVSAEDSNYRSATAAPEAWQTFARQLQGRIEQQLAGDDERARRFQDYLAGSGNGTDARSPTFVLRAWVLADGKVDRVEFDGIDDADAIINLRALLVGDNVGAPPPEMLQPLHLRLSLRAKDQPRQDQ
jgi:hypothetical protein